MSTKSATQDKDEFDVGMQASVRPLNEEHDEHDDGSLPPPVNTNPQPPKRKKLPDPVLPKRRAMPAAPVKPRLLVAEPPDRTPAVPLQEARRTLAGTSPVPSDMRRWVLSHPTVRQSAEKAIQAAAKYRSECVRLDVWSIVGAFHALPKLTSRIGNAVPDPELFQQIVAADWMSQGGIPQRKIQTSVRNYLRGMFVKTVYPTVRALHDAVLERCKSLIETVEQQERAFDATLGILWTGGRVKPRLERVQNDLLTTLSNHGRPVTSYMPASLAFVDLCEEALGGWQPLNVPAADGTPVHVQLLPTGERRWFAVENCGPAPIRVTVNPARKLSEWPVVHPGHHLESNQIIATEFDTGQINADARSGGQYLAGQRVILTQSAVFAVNESGKPVEVIVYTDAEAEPAKK